MRRPTKPRIRRVDQILPEVEGDKKTIGERVTIKI